MFFYNKFYNFFNYVYDSICNCFNNIKSDKLEAFFFAKKYVYVHENDGYTKYKFVPEMRPNDWVFNDI
jgi:hypothetical protein